MPLTIVTLALDGSPDDELDIDPALHELLAEEAARLLLPLPARMSNYYCEVDYARDAIGALIDEADTLQRLGDRRLAHSLQELAALASRAMQKKVGLAVISD